MSEKSYVVQLFGVNFDVANCLSGLLTAILVFALVYGLSRKVAMKPGKAQNLLEWIIDFTDGIVGNYFNKSEKNLFGLYAFVLFLFIFVANQLGLFLQVTINGHIFIKSPTSSPLITMTIAAIGLLLAYFYSVEKNGFGGYVKNYAKPLALFPINILEQFTNFLTLSLRLFGNIYAGEILLTLIGHQMAQSGPFAYVAAIPLEMIWQGFSVFIGAIQAYIFVTLTSVYVSNNMNSEE